MKRILILAAATAALSLSTLSAQSFEGVRVHFDQNVEVAGNTLPAGDYSITMIKSNGDVPLMRFTSDAGFNAVVFASRQQRPVGESAAHTDVILDKSGPVERIARVEVAGSEFYYALPLHH